MIRMFNFQHCLKKNKKSQNSTCTDEYMCMQKPLISINIFIKSEPKTWGEGNPTMKGEGQLLWGKS